MILASRRGENYEAKKFHRCGTRFYHFWTVQACFFNTTHEGLIVFNLCLDTCLKPLSSILLAANLLFFVLRDKAKQLRGKTVSETEPRCHRFSLSPMRKLWGNYEETMRRALCPYVCLISLVTAPWLCLEIGAWNPRIWLWARPDPKLKLVVTKRDWVEACNNKTRQSWSL